MTRVNINLDFPAIDAVYQQITGRVRAKSCYPAWTSTAVYMSCPEKYRLRYIAKAKGVDTYKDEKEIGILVHYLLSHYYNKTSNYPPQDLIDRFRFDNADPMILEEGWRIFQGYILEYEGDCNWKVLSNEKTYSSIRENYSATPDLTIEVIQPSLVDGTDEGIYLVDHKTKGRFDKSISLWRHDGEILGEIMAFLDSTKSDLGSEDLEVAEFASNLLSRFRGVIINLIGKQKDQRFARVVVPFNEADIDEFRRNLAYWGNQRKLSQITGYYPRNNTACVTGFPCDFYTTCWRD